MANFPTNEQYDMFCTYIKCYKNSRLAAQTYFNNFPERRQPHIKVFKRLDVNMQEYGCLRKPNRNSNLVVEDEVLTLACVAANPNISTREIETQVNVSKSRASRILKKHKFHPYKLHISQTLRPNDHIRRSEFCRWFINKITQNGDFVNRVLWTDESYFSNCGLFNRHNEHHWAQENPHVVIPRRNQVRFGFNVFCGILGNRLVGPVIFDGNLTAQKYLEILQTSLEDLLDDLPLAQNVQIWYQQDGAPAHNARNVINYLNDRFNNRVIATNALNQWPPRSADLTPLDFYLWGTLKNKVYASNFHYNNAVELREAVVQAFNGVNRNTLRKVTGSVEKRCRLCLANNGQQFEHLL